MGDLIEKLRRNKEQRVAAMCYIIHGDKVLLLHRVKEPFQGFLVPPGGKREENENIYECIKREIFEETGLNIKNPKLKVVTTEIGPKNYNWILFIFICSDFYGELKESSEGKLTWKYIKDLPGENMSQIDKMMLPYIFDEKQYIMYLRYDENKNCTIENLEEICLENNI